MNTTLKNAYITAQAKELVLTRGLTLEKAKETVAEELLTAARTKGTLALIANTLAAVKNMAVKLLSIAFTNPWSLAILAAGAAIIGLTLAINANTNAQKKLDE
jgi:hypothetical protein